MASQTGLSRRTAIEVIRCEVIAKSSSSAASCSSRVAVALPVVPAVRPGATAGDHLDHPVGLLFMEDLVQGTEPRCRPTPPGSGSRASKQPIRSAEPSAPCSGIQLRNQGVDGGRFVLDHAFGRLAKYGQTPGRGVVHRASNPGVDHLETAILRVADRTPR